MTANEAVKQIEEISAETQKTVTAQYDKVTKSIEDVAAFNQQTVNALVESGSNAVKAVEQYNNELAAYAKKSVEENVAAAKELADVKSVNEYFEKQSALVKTNYEGAVAQAKKFNELAQTGAKETFAPLQARATAAQDLLKGYNA